MSLWQFINYSPNSFFYGMRDKLYQHSLSKSKDFFDKAQCAREKIKTAEELAEYQKKFKDWFIDSIGGIPYDKNYPLNSKTVDIIEEDNIIIEKVIFEAREGIYVTANLYVPKKRREKCPAVLFQLGHSGEGKASSRYQKVARILTSYGLIVLVADPVGQGERSGYVEKGLSAPMIPRSTFDHQMGGDPCFLTGKQSIRYFIADAMRCIDYLISRREVDPEKIGATGSSGGGTMTACIAVCDDRVKAAAPGTFITNREEYIYAGSAQDSEQIWFGSTKEGFDHYELLLCAAPIPYMILAADSDFFPLEGTEKVYNFCKPLWGLLGKTDNLKIHIDRTLHAFSDNLGYVAGQFFTEAFNMDNAKIDVSSAVLSEKELYCTKSGSVSLDFSDARFLHEENKLVYEEMNLELMQLPAEEREKNVKNFLRKVMYEGRTQIPLKIRTFKEEYDNGLKVQPLMWFSQNQLPNFGMLFTKFSIKELQDEPVIVLYDRGTDGLEDLIDKIRDICKSGGAAFVVDLSGMGKNTPYDLNGGRQVKDRYGALDRIVKDMFFYGDSLCALRLFELECAQRVVKKLYPGNTAKIYARGLCAVYAKLYKLLYSDCQVETEGFSGKLSDIVTSKYYENYNIAGVLLPGILKYIDI
ncbi:MAG: acetylxylan esterase [Clostridia bacterium]|nr:acetylxylan esterase [Clostridia bacterium]